jgi:short-subunit dehydrogenase
VSAASRRRIVVLGASSGLGAAFAVVHARRGDEVIVVARREERLAQLRRELLPTLPDDSWVPIRADLSNAGDIEALADRLSAWHLDRLYLSAGANQPVVTGGVTERLRIIEPYFRLIFYAYIVLTEHLIENEALGLSSRVVAISSLAAVIPFPKLELYSTGKAALEGWCRGARDRSGPRFTVVRPGLFKSEFFRPSETLRSGDLPLQRAARIVRLVDQDRDFIDVGGWRDVTANRLSSLLGPCARRILPNADFDGSSVLDPVPGRRSGAT